VLAIAVWCDFSLGVAGKIVSVFYLLGDRSST